MISTDMPEMNFLQEAIYLELKTHGDKTEAQIRQALKADGWDARPRTVADAIEALIIMGKAIRVKLSLARCFPSFQPQGAPKRGQYGAASNRLPPAS